MLTAKDMRKRFQVVSKGEKVYCSDGTVHLVDEAAIQQSRDLYEQNIEYFN